MLSEGNLPVFGSVMAESQTAGRGRHGRVWLSAPGHVYAAMRLPEAPPFSGSSASIATALMMAMALEAANPAISALIKWPNDLIAFGGKIGGILLENRNGSLIAGIGLNLGEPPIIADRDPQAPPPAAIPLGLMADIPASAPDGMKPSEPASLSATIRPGFPASAQPDSQAPVRPSFPASTRPPLQVSNNPEITAILGSKAFDLWKTLAKYCQKYYNEKFRLCQADWAKSVAEAAQARLLGMGRLATIKGPATTPKIEAAELRGVVTGLDPSGALRLATSQGALSVWSGDLVIEDQKRGL